VSAPVFLASFDVEDWFHAENIRPWLPTSDWSALPGHVERNTHELLDILAEGCGKSTFFVLGWVARRYPALVRRIVAEGHELASHTDLHMLLRTLSRDAVAEELLRSRDSLEQVGGTRVLGVRAPNFSISDEVLDCMAEAGYWYDSSYFSLRAHGRYGRISGGVDADEPIVEVRPRLLELPLSRVRLGRRIAVPWAGGAYFRMIPFRVFRAGVAHRLESRSWFMFYMHPWELDDREPPPAGLPRLLRLRAYAARGRMRSDLRRLLAEFPSRRIDDALTSLGYTPPA
jgi:polysaccharide deacetylase family protein (PEP-CTERM system associated)